MASVVRTLLRPASLLAPLNGSDRIAPAIGDFYIWASGGSVTLPAARYDYNSDWSPLLAGLSPAGIAASLAALVHVSVRPPCHPGRSPLASPVGDHDCPCAIFPVSLRLKRSLAYPHATQVYFTVRWSSTCSTFAGAESGAAAHLPSVMTESPFAPSRRCPLGRRVPAS